MRFLNWPREMNELLPTTTTTTTKTGVSSNKQTNGSNSLNSNNNLDHEQQQQPIELTNNQNCHLPDAANSTKTTTRVSDQTFDDVIEIPSRNWAPDDHLATTCFGADSSNCFDIVETTCGHANELATNSNCSDNIDDRQNNTTTNNNNNDDNNQRAPSPTPSLNQPPPVSSPSAAIDTTERAERQQRNSLGQLSQQSSDKRHRRRLLSQSSQSGNLIVRRFQKFDASALSCAPSPDVKIGQRVAYKEYYGNEFGTIRWIGRVPQISPDWTVGIEFDNAIGEGDGSLNGRRYFIAKDCFAKFLPLIAVALVDQHVGRPEPGTMISVMSAAVRPGQMISIQRVSTVHVQHCFLNAPHQRPGAEFLAVNTRLHCQCPSCGPCAHVVKPPRTQRLLTPKNATHMCQFSTYTCCGMESSDEALCTYTGNKISSLPPPVMTSSANGGYWPPVGNSWMEGSGYLSQLQAEQRKLMPEEYRLGAAPEDTLANALLRRSSSGRRRDRREGQDKVGVADNINPTKCDVDVHKLSPVATTDQVRASSKASGRHHHHHHHHRKHKHRHAFPTTQTSPTAAELDQHRPGDGLRSPIYANLGQKEAVDMQSGQSQQQQQQQQQQKPSKPVGTDTERQTDNNLGPDSEFNDVMPPSACCQRPDLSAIAGVVAVGSNQSDYATAARDANGVEQRGQGIGQLKELAGQADDELGLEFDDGLDSDELDGEETAATRPAVQYRDSIENRYLFPTDDVIDSTLEADLETLSQARYGRFGQARSSVSNCSSEDSHRRRKRPAAAAAAAARLTRAARRHWRGDDRSNQNGTKTGARRQHETAPYWGQRRGRRERRRQQRRVSVGSGSSALDKRNNRGRRHERHRSGGGHRETTSQITDDDDDDDDEDEDQYDQVDDYYQNGRRHWRRSGRTTPSRNIILKGLRSLVVSCLSANEQPSEATTPTSKSNHAFHHNHHHQRHRRNVDSASPVGLQVEYANPNDVGCCCQANSAAPAPFAHFFANQNGTGDGLHQAEVLAGQLEQLNLTKAAANTAAFMSWTHAAAQDDQLEANYYMNLDLTQSNQWHHNNNNNNNHHHHHHQSHSTHNARECDNFKGNTQPDGEQAASSHWSCQQAPIGQQPNEPPARRQISSSSDCGFSSASQNSMNLTNNSNSSSNGVQVNGTQSNADEQRQLVQIYKRLAAQLAKGSGQHSASSDDLLRLKRALIEVHSESCNSCQNQTDCQRPAGRQSDTDSRRATTKPPVETDSSQEKFAQTINKQTRAPLAEMISGGGGGEANPSSEPTSRAPSRGCDQFDESQRTLATRPFELKLTLSFNPDLTSVSNFDTDHKQAQS